MTASCPTMAVRFSRDRFLRVVKMKALWNHSKSSLPGWLLFLAAACSVDAASVVHFSAASYQVSENAGKVLVEVQRSSDVQSLVSVEVATAAVTATAGVDYTATNSTLTFDAGITNLTFEIPILNDGVQESAESLDIYLTNLTAGAVLGTPAVTRVTVVDNDQPTQLEFRSYEAGEADDSVVIAVIRGDDGGQPVNVNYTTAGQSASPGLDFIQAAGSLTFDPGETVKLVPIQLLNDGLKEPTKLFRFMLTNITGGVLSGQRTATVYVRENDLGIELTATRYWVHEFEGALEVTVRRGNDRILDPFTVDYATTNGTARAGEDFVSTRGTLQFSAGVMTQSFTIPIVNDETPETHETFQVVLSNPSGPLPLGPGTSMVVTICDSTGWTPNSLALTVEGGVMQLTSLARPFSRFSKFFDLHPIDFTDDFAEWQPLTLWHETGTPESTRLLVSGPGETNLQARFYGTPDKRYFSLFLKDLGPYPVGVRDFMLTDASRRNRYNISSNGSFAISVWYPAKPLAGRTPERWIPEPMARDHSPTGLFLAYGEPVGSGVWMEWVPHLYSRSFRDLPFAEVQGGCPVVIYSPGWVGPRAAGTEPAEHLASRGYVVVSVDHFDCYNVAWPNGFYQSSSLNKEMSLAGLADRVRDLSFIVDALTRWNLSDPFFQGKLNLNRLGVIGKSWGGGTAGEFGRSDARCRAVVLLDPGGDAPPIPNYAIPSLTAASSDWSDFKVFNASRTNAVFFRLTNSDHGSLGSFYAYSIYPLDANREVSRTINAYTLSFFNKHLLGHDDGLLNGPPDTNQFPRVINFRIK